MTFLYYIKYFFYIALNWNLRLAFFSIYHEIKGEIKYGIDTCRLDDLQKLPIKGENKQHAEIYQGASYYLLEDIFSKLQTLHAPKDITDMGSGKGRVLVVAAHYGFTKIRGIDFAGALCKEATKNCRRITERFPATHWEILHANAANFSFDKHDHVVFFFNPFKEAVMTSVINNILASLDKSPRKILVVYINPQLKKLFTDAGFNEIYYVRKMQFVDAVILEING